ncbi:MAG: hypothetical protein ACXIVQ_03195 [Acidimicrobiales bacterium]
MFETLDEIERQLSEVVRGLDAASIDAAAAAALVDRAEQVSRLAGVITAVAAERIEATDAWRGSGARDAVGFVALRTGVPRGRIRDAVAVARSLESLPVLDRAVRHGAVTLDQAADIASAANEHPDTESELVAFAAHATPRQLKERCVEIMARGDGAERQHRRATAERSCSSQTGRDAVWRLSARLPIIDGALVDKALDYFQTQAFDDARRRGEREPYAAYRADALVRMANAALNGGAACTGVDATESEHTTSEPAGGSRTRRRRGVPSAGSSALRHTIVVTVPHTVFTSRCGHGQDTAADEDTCQVPGVGPVPTSVVHDLIAADPIIKAVVTKGRDITAVATVTRTVLADLRLAVLAANDLHCAVPDCDSTRFLELDHEQLFSADGATSYDNLRPLCSAHHDMRTLHGYELLGRPGAYRWIGPDGTTLAAERSATPS